MHVHRQRCCLTSDIDGSTQNYIKGFLKQLDSFIAHAATLTLQAGKKLFSVTLYSFALLRSVYREYVIEHDHSTQNCVWTGPITVHSTRRDAMNHPAENKCNVPDKLLIIQTPSHVACSGYSTPTQRCNRLQDTIPAFVFFCRQHRTAPAANRSTAVCSAMLTWNKDNSNENTINNSLIITHFLTRERSDVTWIML
jgi:hypothetical protein